VDVAAMGLIQQHQRSLKGATVSATDPAADLAQLVVAAPKAAMVCWHQEFHGLAAAVTLTKQHRLWLKAATLTVTNRVTDLAKPLVAAPKAAVVCWHREFHG
jgi:hypothetical protein